MIRLHKSNWRLPIFNGFVSFLSYSIYPYLLLQWKQSFGLGWAFSTLVLLSILSRVLGAFSLSKMDILVGNALPSLCLFIAGLGAFGYKFSALFYIQILAVSLLGLAHGLWAANVQKSIVLTSPNSAAASKKSSSFQLISNFGVIGGSLLSNPLNSQIGFSSSSVLVSVGFLALAITYWLLSELFTSTAQYSPKQPTENSIIGSDLSYFTWAALGTISILIAYSAINYLAPLLAKTANETFPVGNLFAVNAAIVLFLQMGFLKFQALHKWQTGAITAAVFLTLSFISVLTLPIGNMTVYLFVTLISLSEVLLFPSLSGLFTDIVQKHGTNHAKAASVLTISRVIGLGLGGVVWPKMSNLSTAFTSALGIGLVIVSIGAIFIQFKFKDIK